MLGGSKSSIRALDDYDDDFVHLDADPEYEFRMRNRRLGDDALTTALSAFYAKLIVVLGIAFPVTDILGAKTPNVFYQGFYLYLYIVSVTFVGFMYVTRTRSRKAYSAKTGRTNGTRDFVLRTHWKICNFFHFFFFFFCVFDQKLAVENRETNRRMQSQCLEVSICVLVLLHLELGVWSILDWNLVNILN